jgi:hypothetical protein
MCLYLFSIPLAHSRLDLAQTLRDPQDTIDQHTVRRPLDLEIAEQRVGPEQRERLVQNVVAFAVRVHVELTHARRQRRKRVRRSAGLGAESGEAEVADDTGIGVAEECGVVGL